LTPRWFHLIRHATLALVGIASILTGGGLLWLWFTPERIGGVETLPLVALLGLFVLPAGAAGLMHQAWRLDREMGAQPRTLRAVSGDRRDAPGRDRGGSMGNAAA